MRKFASCLLAAFLTLLPFALARPADDEPWKPVEAALGRKGQLQPDGVMKFGMPRSDLTVTVGGLPIRPPLALGGWMALDSSGKAAHLMGDLVLTEAEVAPVMARLEQDGMAITALHNHLMNESPRTLYLHIFGSGDARALAAAVRNALLLTGTPAPASPLPPRPPDLDASAIEQAIGYKGRMSGGVFQVSVPRVESITLHGARVPASLGIATALNFQAAGDGKAAATGDFVLLADEVNPVIRVLAMNQVAVTALHSHMLDESPRLFFLHFWAVDDAVKLAHALRTALAKTNSVRQQH